jgi:ribosomal protein L12E/L44/L45/RPP1/RPP2
MKKLLTLMLGMSLAFGTVAVTFAQDNPPQKEDQKDQKKKSKKKGSKKKQDEQKKEGSN